MSSTIVLFSPLSLVPKQQSINYGFGISILSKMSFMSDCLKNERHASINAAIDHSWFFIWNSFSGSRRLYLDAKIFYKLSCFYLHAQNLNKRVFILTKCKYKRWISSLWQVRTRWAPCTIGYHLPRPHIDECQNS